MACWAVLPLVVRGTTAYKQYYRPQRGTAAAGQYQGVISGHGEVSLPHTHSLAPSFLDLSPAVRRRGRAPADLLLRGAPLLFLRWSRSPPRPLAMDASIAPVPLLFVVLFQILCLGAIVFASVYF